MNTSILLHKQEIDYNRLVYENKKLLIYYYCAIRQMCIIYKDNEKILNIIFLLFNDVPYKIHYI